MKYSEIQTGVTYGIPTISRKDREHTWFDHAELLVANIRSYDELEAAGYVARRPGKRFTRYSAEDAAEETARIEDEVRAGKVLLSDDSHVRALRKAGDEYNSGKLQPLQIVRIIGDTRVRDGQVKTELLDPPQLRIVSARELFATATDLLERADQAAASERASAQRAAEQSEQLAATDSEIDQLLARHGIDAAPSPHSRSGQGEQRAVPLTLAQLRQLVGEA